MQENKSRLLAFHSHPFSVYQCQTNYRMANTYLHFQNALHRF